MADRDKFDYILPDFSPKSRLYRILHDSKTKTKLKNGIFQPRMTHDQHNEGFNDGIPKITKY